MKKEKSTPRERRLARRGLVEQGVVLQIADAESEEGQRMLAQAENVERRVEVEDTLKKLRKTYIGEGRQ
jgi:hypothetical protein